MRIPTDIQEVMNKDRAFVFATASKSAIPNINVIGIKQIEDDETVLLADNYFDKTLANLKVNSEAAILTKNAEKKLWYQLKGTCQYINEGPRYEKFKEWVKSKRETFPAKGMVIFKVKQIYNTSAGPDAGKPINN
ncbi:MAG: pyridoxamine 5'-phosphate oxidase family protein [Atribacterota bacterium]|nr:pyridoxamine 5'-phosphate oxidase family protein [Atribacterota bacterium]